MPPNHLRTLIASLTLQGGDGGDWMSQQSNGSLSSVIAQKDSKMNTNTTLVSAPVQTDKTLGTKKLVAAKSVVILVLFVVSILMPQQASAGGWASVQVGAPVYDQVQPLNYYVGTVSRNPPYTVVVPRLNYQTSVWMTCYRDADWYTGNYRSNRWFLVYLYVDHQYSGQWRDVVWVHSSYVDIQPRVGRC